MARRNEKISVGFLFDDTLDSNDGVAQYVKNVGAWLSSHGHSVSYIVGETKLHEWAGGEVISGAHNLKIRWGGNRLSMPIWPDKSKIKTALRSKKFDVLHVQMPYSPMMSQYVIKNAPADTAVVGTFHVFPANELAVVGSRLLRLIYGKSLRRIGEVVSVSSAAEAFAKKGFKLNTFISSNVVDLKKFEVDSANINKRPRIVFLGRLVKRKGCLQLLKAFKIVNQKMPDVELVIAGDGPLRPSLEKYVRSHNLDRNVVFKGFIDEKDKPDLLHGADIACFPSLYGESFGIVLIEAMAAGAGAVLGGDNPGYCSVLGDQPDLLINPRATQAFADRLYKLLTNRALREGLHAWQQNEVRQYDINVVGPQLEAVYASAIARLAKNSHN